MGSGAWSKRYREPDLPKMIVTPKKEPTLTLKQLAAGRTAQRRCPDCGAPIKDACYLDICPHCSMQGSASQPQSSSTPRLRQSSRSRIHLDESMHSQSTLENTSRQSSKQSTRGPRDSHPQRRISKSQVQLEDWPNSQNLSDHDSRQSSKRSSKGSADEDSSTTAEFLSRRNSREFLPPPFADLHTQLPEASHAEAGGEMLVHRRKSLQRRASTVASYPGEIDMGVYKVGDRVVGEGRVGLEMGIGTVIGPGAMSESVEIKFDVGTVWTVKIENLCPPITASTVEEAYKKKVQQMRRPSK